MPTGLYKNDVFNHICNLLADCESVDEFDEAIRLAYVYLDEFDDRVGFEAILSLSRFVIIDFDD